MPRDQSPGSLSSRGGGDTLEQSSSRAREREKVDVRDAGRPRPGPTALTIARGWVPRLGQRACARKRRGKAFATRNWLASAISGSRRWRGGDMLDHRHGHDSAHAGRWSPDHDPDGQRDGPAAVPDAACGAHDLVSPSGEAARSLGRHRGRLARCVDRPARLLGARSGHERRARADDPLRCRRNAKRRGREHAAARDPAGRHRDDRAQPWSLGPCRRDGGNRSGGRAWKPTCIDPPRLLATSAHSDSRPRSGRAARDQPLSARGRWVRDRRGTPAVVPARRLGPRDGRGRSHDTVRDGLHGARSRRSR